MTIKIRYVYSSFNLGCDCCFDSVNYIEMFNEELYEEIPCDEYLSDEEELKEYMKEHHADILEYEIQDDCEWF